MRTFAVDPARVGRRLGTVSEQAAAGLAQLAVGLVAIGFGIAPEQILSPSRRAPIVFARQSAMYLVHVVFRISLSQVGRAFGRDRTTASHACHVVEDAREDRQIDALIESCAQSLCGLSGFGLHTGQPSTGRSPPVAVRLP
jgi:Bacterial dnaA protein helix-turn-helix